jgi:ribosome-associated heat shock protein Hsp15
MRLDVYLKKCCLVKQRSEAKKACDNGIVQVDGLPSKAARLLNVGQHVSIAFTDRLIEVEILSLPLGNVSKNKASNYYRVIRDEVLESDFF